MALGRNPLVELGQIVLNWLGKVRLDKFNLIKLQKIITAYFIYIFLGTTEVQL